MPPGPPGHRLSFYFTTAARKRWKTAPNDQPMGARSWPWLMPRLMPRLHGVRIAVPFTSTQRGRSDCKHAHHLYTWELLLSPTARASAGVPEREGWASWPASWPAPWTRINASLTFCAEDRIGPAWSGLPSAGGHYSQPGAIGQVR